PEIHGETAHEASPPVDQVQAGGRCEQELGIAVIVEVDALDIAADGCGVKYFSQDAVIKLAPAAGIELDKSLSLAEQLKVVQALMKEGDPRAAAIYDTIGAYFGYAIAFYSEFYDLKHVLIMGRVTSGQGGVILLERAQQVLDEEFPELAKKVTLHIPDEKSRRVGQSVAAASLPEIKK
ncbi:MAG: ROK family protein, partial [Firmicutes bacterium]|nr:ROK family protein [Bacillota bacterium]